MLRLKWNVGVFLGLALSCAFASADDAQFEKGREAILGRTGCFLVDYSYAETEALKPGYTLDGRIYDVNGRQSVKEWVYSEELSEKRVRLQHILFATDLSGKMKPDSLLKHQAEDWEYDASFLYDFSGPSTWMVKDLKPTPGLWTRKITNLDDGLRYQCAAGFDLSASYPEWTCDNYSPIPGRETRDMGRKDYNTLQRSTRIISYGSSWLERQANIKTIDQSGVRTPLVKELGKIWYVKLPDSECAEARAFVQPRQAIWNLLRETWDTVLTGDRPFIEKSVPNQPPRFAKMIEIEEAYTTRDLSDASVRKAAQATILQTISDYRAN